MSEVDDTIDKHMRDIGFKPVGNERSELHASSGSAHGRCVRWGCEDAALVWRNDGDWHKNMNGDRTISAPGWYCPVCGGGYGGTAPNE